MVVAVVKNAPPANRSDTPIPRPMMAVLAPELPSGSDWTYEVKWDGYRTIAVKHGDRVRLISRNAKDLTASYPSVAAAVGGLKASHAILDGEVVALLPDGRPSFQALQHRTAASSTIVYYAFDLLALAGLDLTRKPLDERRTQLARVVKGSHVRLSESLPGTPKQILDEVGRLGLEGVVAKRRTSRYEPGTRSDAWIKVRLARRQEFVVGGYKPADRAFESILVGHFEKNQLYFSGKVRAGFTPHLRNAVMARLAGLEVSRCPFVNLPNSTGKSHWGEGITAEDMRALRWVKPTVVVEVAFTEWTDDGLLRHASFVALRDDKSPRAVHRERGRR